MGLINQLSRDHRFYGTCPHCGEAFQLSRAVMFDIHEPFPEEAIKKLAEIKTAIAERKEEIRRQKSLAAQKAAITTESVNIGKVVEKIAPSFPSFMFSPHDCRALFEPIDYLIFPDLAKRHRVDCVIFADVKSGNARLKSMQREIHRFVDAGKVFFRPIKKERASHAKPTYGI